MAERGLVTRLYFQASWLHRDADAPDQISNDANDLLRIGILPDPGRSIANYLDTDPATNPSMTVDRMGRWRLIVEGATPTRPTRNERFAEPYGRAVYRQRGC
jgi:hypothetical protein